MRGTEFEKYKKDYISLPTNEGDAFTIMKPVQPSQATSQIPSKKIAERIKKINEEKYINLINEGINLKEILNFKFISARRDVTNKEIDKTLSVQTSRIYAKKSNLMQI